MDFDLALNDVEQDDLVEICPREHVQKDPHSTFVMAGCFIGKRDFRNLSEEGYKVATRANPSHSSQRRAFC